MCYIFLSHLLKCVFQTERRGGRCTRLAYTGPYICQSGDRFDFRPSCAGIMQRRNPGN